VRGLASGWRGTIGIVFVAAALGGCSEEADNGASGIPTAKLAATYAPLVGLHPREPWLPIGADEFVDESTLRWRDGCGDDPIAAGGRAVDAPKATEDGTPVPRLDPKRLGRGGNPYRRRVARPPSCREAARFATDGYTRPNDPLRANDIALEEGFYLDLDDAERTVRNTARGDSVSADVYFEGERERHRGRAAVRITYWLLLRLDRLPGPAAATEPVGHEGDWERFSVLLRRRGDDLYAPIAARYGTEGRDVPWPSVPRTSGPRQSRTHPMAFAALGSHTLYSRPGNVPLETHTAGGPQFRLQERTTACPNCVRWHTWAHLHPARSQPWYGYGGAWGDSLGERTAPGGLGPSRWTDVKPFELDE